jgi:hypothetical protein
VEGSVLPCQCSFCAGLLYKRDYLGLFFIQQGAADAMYTVLGCCCSGNKLRCVLTVSTAMACEKPCAHNMLPVAPFSHCCRAGWVGCSRSAWLLCAHFQGVWRGLGGCLWRFDSVGACRGWEE